MGSAIGDVFSTVATHELKSWLEEIMPRKEFQEAGFPNHLYPKVLQPSLPKGTTKEAVLRHCIDRPLLSLYRNASISRAHSICIFSWIMTHGFGDLIAQFEIARILKERFPYLPIYLISLIHRSASLPLDCPVANSTRLEFDTDEEMKLSYFKEEVLEEMRGSALLLQTPTYYPYTSELWEKLKTMKHPNPFPMEETLGEYGFIQAPWAHPNTNARCLGLHFLEKGIITSPKKSFSSNEKQRFCFAYLITDEGHYLYLHALVQSLKIDQRDIDLVTPDIGGFLRALQQWFLPHDLEVFRRFGIKDIWIYFDKKRSHLPVQEEGKTLRISHVGRISPDEFKRRVILSEGVYGCRGDQSFSLAISNGRPFFYDGLTHAEPFLQDLLFIAKTEFPSAHLLHRSLEISLMLMEENVPIIEIGNELGEIFQNERFQEDMKSLCDLIRKNYSANSLIGDLVSRSLVHYDRPEMREFEKQILDQLFQKRLCFSKAMHLISQHLG